MDRDESKRHAAALRDYLEARLPMAGVKTISGLARKAGLRHSTLTTWWTGGAAPSTASLQRLAGAIGVDVTDLVAVYQGTPDPNERTFALGKTPLTP
jgi:transcriptional regulator with XRE-family HTH domain